MPIYEYRCESCGKELEKIQKFSDPPLSDCPYCGKPALKKLVSASSFRLKGSGWYETDFKTKKPTAGSDKDSDNSTKGAGEGTGDSKKSGAGDNKSEGNKSSKTGSDGKSAGGKSAASGKDSN